MLLTADRGFYSFPAWNQARHSGAHLLWRSQAGLRPYWLGDLEDGSWLAVITKPSGLRRSQKDRLREAARQGRDLDPEHAVIVRVVDYTVPDRKGRAHPADHQHARPGRRHRRGPGPLLP